MRLGVLDAHVVVDQLLALDHVEAVERRLATLAVEDRDDVVAHDCAAPGDRVGREVRVAVLPDRQCRHLVGVERFALQLVVVDHGVGADDRLSHRHRKVLAVAHRHVVLDQRDLARLLGDQQDAGEVGDRLL